jgi:DNA topoisomerase I
MGYELIITEKPQAAKKIAEALADSKAKKESHNKVPYYTLRHNGNSIVVGCAVGHLFTVAEKNKGKWHYPVFDVEWVASSKTNKGAAYISKYLNTLKKLSKGADTFTVACDFDIEGEVIGYNVIRFICKEKDAQRMKFSTLTKNELVNSYEHKLKHIEWGQANAGVTRHELDWYYGINLSRALTLAVKTTGMFKILSSGRVQGPALKIIVEKEKIIQKFKPEPFWQIELNGKIQTNKITAMHKEDKFWDKEKANAVMEKTDGHDGKLSKIDKREFSQKAPFPFDLTTLQTEAYRSLHIQPKKTLEFAQELYIAGLISYPRTSSQKLPPTIGYDKILKKLQNQQFYKELAGKLLTKGNLKPNEGKKEDPAHPAIYPTGNISDIDGQKAKIYDLIVRRFLATFADISKRETITFTIDINSEEFMSKGTRTVVPGWQEYYGSHVKIEEQTMPDVKEGDELKVKKIEMHDKETQPPKRYSPASIIKALEKRGLGTKSTRAAIVDSLFKRGYVHETSIQATALGIHVCDTLNKYCPQILDVDLTKLFEELMEEIRENKKTPEQVLTQAREKLKTILEGFKENEKKIGKELADSLKNTRNVLNHVGKCPTCKDGDLEIRKGKYGQFIACNKYPDCKTTFKLPTGGKFKVQKDVCKECNYPTIMIFKGKKPQKLCINDDCPSKKIADPKAAKEIEEVANGKKEKLCPKCKEPLLLRKSIYGQFFGCSKFPKCRYTERIEDNGNGKKEETEKKE